MDLQDLSIDLKTDQYLLEGVNAGLAKYIDDTRKDLASEGYSRGLESDAANRAVYSFRKVWGLRKFPLSVDNVPEIQPRLVEMVLSLELLGDITVASKSPVADKRVGFINGCVVTPKKYIQALRSYHTDVESIGAENDSHVKKAILDKYLPLDSPIQSISQMSPSIVGANTCAEAVFRRNIIEREEYSPKQLNQLISDRVNKLNERHIRNNILANGQKQPRVISEFCWATMMYKDAEIKGLRLPLLEDEKLGVEIAQVIYACPNYALRFMTSNHFIDGITNYVQYIFDENKGETEETCILEILLGLISGEDLKKLKAHKLKDLTKAANALYG